MSPRRVRLRIGGTVQGVGFRPYVFRLANALELGGFVCNDARGVLVEVEGAPPALDAFVQRLPVEAPPLAVCDTIVREEIAPVGANAFTIGQSIAAPQPRALVSPDTATCADCLRELFDPSDRRYRYPFVNCTNCGPRFTIVRGVPYDRSLTTMASFRMCARCQAEYDDPADRRFHAQPNACPACGPMARLVDGSGRPAAASAVDAVAAASRALRDGAIVAVKGVGGYHLACRADHEATVARLRARKHREAKPFAIMVSSVASARALAELDALDERLLTGRERPIVLVRRRRGAAVASAVAPGHRDLGLMLPYSPLHHLLLADTETALVMTSGNVSDEPIAYEDDDALARLAGIADLFLVHNRPIEWRTDDSIVRGVSLGGIRRPMMLRRSRGYVPSALRLPVPAVEPVLACGGQLKNTFCLARGTQAWIGPHVGDLANFETLESYERGIAHHERLVSVSPATIAHDEHPDYLATNYALDRAERTERDTIGVQHHHAHLAACLAEHGEEGVAIGIIFDGSGYGSDGSVWGGEVLIGDLASFERVGHVRTVSMPGGETAVREPWRMACAWLCDCEPSIVPERPRMMREFVDEGRWQLMSRLARSVIASPRTSSMGRLFDALAAICGVRCVVSYEGQAAIELEMAADTDEWGRYELSLGEEDGQLILDPRPLVRSVVADLEAGVRVPTVASRIHNGVAEAAARTCRVVADRRGVRTVVLSGGVFQNVLLLERTAAMLDRGGFRVLVPERLPPNDGGLSFGQAAVACARAAIPTPIQ